jgi:hypothetical protein
VYEKLCTQKLAEARRIEEQERKRSPYGALIGPTFDAANILRVSGFEQPEVHGLRRVVLSQHEIAHVNVLRGR